MKRYRELIHTAETRNLKVAAEDASGIVEGKELHKGTTDTKEEDLRKTE